MSGNSSRRGSVVVASNALPTAGCSTIEGWWCPEAAARGTRNENVSAVTISQTISRFVTAAAEPLAGWPSSTGVVLATGLSAQQFVMQLVPRICGSLTRSRAVREMYEWMIFKRKMLNRGGGGSHIRDHHQPSPMMQGSRLQHRRLCTLRKGTGQLASSCRPRTIS